MGDEARRIIEDRWSQREAEGLSGLDLLVYQSRLLGSDSGMVLWGGGNTSLKVEERDFRGRPVLVLRVKGSGSDLKAVTRRDFPGVRMEDVVPLMEREEMSDEEMVEYLSHTLLEPSAPRPSIETLLHAFIPARSVVHSHADAILALTNTDRAGDALREVFGGEVAVVPYRRPGFALSKEVGLAARERPGIKGVVLLNHGLITWHDDAREAYRLHVEMVDRAARYVAGRETSGGQAPHEGRDDSPAQGGDAASVALPNSESIAVLLAPYLRGLLGRQGRAVVHFDGSEEVRRFVSGEVVPLDRLPEVLEAGAATPDHILHAKRTPVWIEADDLSDRQHLRQRAADALARWEEAYRAYHNRQNKGEPLLPAVPRVVLIKNVGLFGVGKDRRAAQVATDIARHTMWIVEAAERVGRYRSLSEEDAFAAEYWPLELYKLSLAPPEKSLSRRVALVTGAAGAIGTAIARRLAAEGAHVVCADLNTEGAAKLAEELTKANPANPALAVCMDVTSEDGVRKAFESAILEYGGVDLLVSNAGIAASYPLDELPLSEWERSFAVNATGHFLVAREALRVMKAQGTGGSIVFIATKNVPAPGKDFGAYSASKAAEVQLARVVAIEGGPHGIRSNIVNPDAIFENSGLWTRELKEERARAQGIAPEMLEEEYRKRNVLQVRVTADDVAEAVIFFASDRSAKTTGAMHPVDGGLREAFPR